MFRLAVLLRRLTTGNKNPRTEIRGKAAGSLPEEARKMREACQFGSEMISVAAEHARIEAQVKGRKPSPPLG